MQKKYYSKIKREMGKEFLISNIAMRALNLFQPKMVEKFMNRIYLKENLMLC